MVRCINYVNFMLLHKFCRSSLLILTFVFPHQWWWWLWNEFWGILGVCGKICFVTFFSSFAHSINQPFSAEINFCQSDFSTQQQSVWHADEENLSWRSKSTDIRNYVTCDGKSYQEIYYVIFQRMIGSINGSEFCGFWFSSLAFWKWSF